jgi:NTP pyrophosphatase (non-canonical NTP hydrolase)
MGHRGISGGDTVNLNDYQEKAAEFRIPGVPNEERVLGLLAEAGEVAGVFQKLIRGARSPLEAEKELFLELGDTLFYLSQIAKDNGWSLAEVANGNIDKLTTRRLRNTLLGDTR